MAVHDWIPAPDVLEGRPRDPAVALLPGRDAQHPRASLAGTIGRPGAVTPARGIVAAGLLWAALGISACGTNRAGLPTPFPLTQGGSPVPAEGIGVGAEFGDALSGAPPERADVLTAFVGASLANRVSASYASYGGRGETDVNGALFRLKVRVGGPFGDLTSVHVAYATMNRTLMNGPHDRLWTADAALPMEFPLTDPRARNRLSLIVGPRVTVARYADALDPTRSKRTPFAGLLAGAHVSRGPFHLFAEGTFTQVPRGEVAGTRYKSRLVFLPTVGALVRIEAVQSPDDQSQPGR